MTSSLLKSLTLVQNKGDNPIGLSFHHLKWSTVPDDLLLVLHSEFADELERGNTYPQEGPFDLNNFQQYFFSADVFVAIQVDADESRVYDLQEARSGRDWIECLYGFYYVSQKPQFLGGWG